MKKLFRVEVWIDGKPVHTFQGPLSHVRNPRLAQTRPSAPQLRRAARPPHPPHPRQPPGASLPAAGSGKEGRGAVAWSCT